MRLHVPPALKHRRFFYFWFGLMISVAGTQMRTWALFWHIPELTDQAIAPFAFVSGDVGSILGLLWFSHNWPQLTTYNSDGQAAAIAGAD